MAILHIMGLGISKRRGKHEISAKNNTSTETCDGLSYFTTYRTLGAKASLLVGSMKHGHDDGWGRGPKVV